MANDINNFKSNIKFYFLDIAANGESLITNHLPVSPSGAIQSLDSLYPSDTDIHYYNCPIYLNTAFSTDLYKSEANYIDATRGGNGCLNIGDMTFESRFFTQILDNYNASTTTTSLGADAVIIPTQVSVENNFTNIVKNFKLLSHQEFGIADDDSNWKDINCRADGKYQYVLYRLPFDVGAAITEFNTFNSNSSNIFNYFPNVTFKLQSITKSSSTSNKWDLRTTCTETRYFGDNKTDFGSSWGDNALSIWVDKYDYYTNDSIAGQTTEDSLWWGSWQLVNNSSNSHYEAPGGLTITLGTDVIGNLEFAAAEKAYGDSWKRFKLRNPNAFSVPVYVPYRRLKNISIDSWSYSTANDAPNQFYFWGWLAGNTTSDWINLGDWDFYEDYGMAAYFIVTYGTGNNCYYKLFAISKDAGEDYTNPYVQQKFLKK